MVLLVGKGFMIGALKLIVDIVSSFDAWDKLIALSGLITAIGAVYMTKKSIDAQNAQSMFKMRTDIYRIVSQAVANFENVKNRISIHGDSFKDSRVPGILEFAGHISLVDPNEGFLHREELMKSGNRELVAGYIKDLESAITQMDLLFSKELTSSATRFLSTYLGLIKTLYDYEIMSCEDMKNSRITSKTARAVLDFLSLEKKYKEVCKAYRDVKKNEIVLELKNETKLSGRM